METDKKPRATDSRVIPFDYATVVAFAQMHGLAVPDEWRKAMQDPPATVEAGEDWQLPALPWEASALDFETWLSFMASPDFAAKCFYSYAREALKTTAAPADPMDWPLPCDVTVGAGTIRKGCPLRILVTRMEVLHSMAMKGAPAGEDARDAARYRELRKLSVRHEGFALHLASLVKGRTLDDFADECVADAAMREKGGQ